MSRGLFMGTPVSLAMFAALVAAVTVVAALTVVGALVLLYFSAPTQTEQSDVDATRLHHRDLLPSFAPMAPVAPVDAYPADGATRIDTPRIGGRLPAFDEEESSLNRDLAPFPRPDRAAWADPVWEQPGRAPDPDRPRAPRRFDRTVGTQEPNAAFGTPEWTEEEGATEIFSAHNFGDMSEFAFVDEEVPATRR